MGDEAIRRDVIPVEDVVCIGRDVRASGPGAMHVAACEDAVILTAVVTAGDLAVTIGLKPADWIRVLKALRSAASGIGEVTTRVLASEGVKI